MRVTNKAVHLSRLQQELVAANVPIRGLGSYEVPGGLEIHTYTAAGAVQDLPAAAQAVLDAHIAPVRKTATETFITELDAAATLADLKVALRKWANAQPGGVALTSR